MLSEEIPEIEEINKKIEKYENQIEECKKTLFDLKQKKRTEQLKYNVKIPDNFPHGKLIKVKVPDSNEWYLRNYVGKTERGTVLCERLVRDLVCAEQLLLPQWEDFTEWECAEEITSDDLQNLVLIPWNLNQEYIDAKHKIDKAQSQEDD